MGYVMSDEEIGSEIVSVELRSESCYIGGEENVHFFYSHPSPESTQTDIVRTLKQLAGEAYANDDDRKAQNLRDIAETVEQLDMSRKFPIHSIEISHEWLREFEKVLPKILKHIGEN